VEEPEKWALFDTKPVSTYSKGNFCILGDAAHASTPHLDAGAGFAIEDAYILSGLLADQSLKSVSDIKHAFAAWDETRRPRCEELISRSRRQGVMLDLTKNQSNELGVGEVLDGLEDNQTWVWNVDLEKMLKQSIEVLERVKKEDEFPPVF
jgi:salicylate hydroxylase